MEEPTSKQPSEEYLIEADFSKVWISGDSVTLASCTFTAVDKTGADKTSTVTDQTTLAASSSGKGIVVRVKGGEVASSPYKLTAKIKTGLNQRWELDIPMVIYDE